MALKMINKNQNNDKYLGAIENVTSKNLLKLSLQACYFCAEKTKGPKEMPTSCKLIKSKPKCDVG